MTAPLENQIEQALAGLRAEHERIRGLQAEIASRTTTAESKNRMVSATVDSAGTVTALEFRGSRYRSLAPAELAAVVVETVATAQAAARTAALEAVESFLPAAQDLVGVGGRGFDLDEMFESAKALLTQPLFSDEQGQTPTEGGTRRG